MEIHEHEKLRGLWNCASNYLKIPKEIYNCMAKLEGYRKDAKHKKIEYYDMYKMQWNTSGMDVYDYKKRLMIYWQFFVAEEDYNPHPHEGDFFWTSWLMAGTNYRRMIEPLHIAEYYMKVGAENYINQRPRHFFLLEQWWNERQKTCFFKLRFMKQNSDDQWLVKQANMKFAIFVTLV